MSRSGSSLRSSERAGHSVIVCGAVEFSLHWYRRTLLPHRIAFVPKPSNNFKRACSLSGCSCTPHSANIATAVSILDAHWAAAIVTPVETRFVARLMGFGLGDIIGILLFDRSDGRRCATGRRPVRVAMIKEMPGKLAYTPIGEPYGMTGEEEPGATVPGSGTNSAAYTESADNDQVGCGRAEPAPDESTPLPGVQFEATAANTSVAADLGPIVTGGDEHTRSVGRVTLPTYIVVGSVVAMLLMLLLMFVSFAANHNRQRF